MDVEPKWNTRGRAVRSLALCAVLGAGTPTVASAQALEVGAGIARTQNPVKALSDAMCPAAKTWAGEGRVAYRFSRAAAIEGTVGYHWEKAGDECEDPVPPVPVSGPFERTLTESPAAGYPFVTTDARLAFEPSTPSGPIWLRAFGGYGRMWSKDIGYWLAGAGLVFGGELEAMLDFEWNWYDVPIETTAESYQDGVLVDAQTEASDMGHSTFRIKAGIRFRP